MALISRTAMIAVYTLFKTDRKVPPVYVGGRRLKSLYNACVALKR
jgi:myosin-crossreactive antigen